MKVFQSFHKFANDTEGVTAIEYGLIAALIAVFIIASVSLVGTNLAALYTTVSTAVAAAV